MSPKVLLVTSVSPGTHGVGQLFLRELVTGFPKDKICCYCVIEKGLFINDDDLSWMPVQYEERLRESGIWRFGSFIGKLTGTIIWNYSRLFKLPGMRRRIQKMALEQNVELIWVILSTPTLINIAKKLSEKLQLPLVVTIWDPPRMLAGNLRFTKADTKRLLTEFEIVLRSTVRCGVASENMAEEYSALYNITPVIQMMPAPDTMTIVPTESLSRNTETFTIGFGGSFYTIEVWNSLFKALDSIDWVLDGKQVKLLLLATQMPFHVRYPNQVTYYGWQPVDKAIEILGGADVLYLPYWFDEDHSEYVRLCFPGKMGTYLKVGKPILFHGPEKSTPAKFIQKYPVGISCLSMETKEIINTLRRFLCEPHIYPTAMAASAEAISRELSPKYFKHQFEILIGTVNI